MNPKNRIIFYLSANTIMNFTEFIIIATIIIILLGCVFLANSSYIYNYFTETTLAAYDRYNIHLIDNDDLNNIGSVLQKTNALSNRSSDKSFNGSTNSPTNGSTNGSTNSPTN